MMKIFGARSLRNCIAKGIVCITTLSPLFLSGCAMSQLKTRAAFDFSCSEDKIVIVGLGGRAYGVQGCDKEATYVMSNSAGWVMNSAIKENKK